MTEVIRIERDGDIAVIVIDNPPINAGSAEVRRGLLAAIETIGGDASIRGAVLIGAGKTFIAGSDLREFDRPLQEPQLPSVIAAIETCGKPVVAALHGAALGGGFELALGCDGRIALAGTVVGLPEVTLGIIPGAGGTQRLPRIVGIPAAIRMIASGERVPAAKALALDMVDAVVDGDLRPAAVAFARRLGHGKTPLRDCGVPVADDGEIAAASRDALKAGRNRPAVRAAVEAVGTAARLPIDEGLARERAAFQELRLSRDARALRHLFFAERESARHPDLAGAMRRTVERIGVIGAGTMGTGIAIAALDGGFQVVLVEADDAALERGARRIADHYASRVATGRLGEADAAGRRFRLTAGTDWTMLADVDLVIEAVFEDLAVKQEVFRRLDAVARPGAVLATNTSYLDVDAIAAATMRPQDVIGLHFFSPANAMRLVEVVCAAASAADALATGLAVSKRLGKLPILTGNAFGFIGNRIYAAYRRQCEFMIEEGAYPEQVDAVLESFGFAMGPFAVADLSGLDIAWRMRQARAATRDPQARYVTIPDRLCEVGRLGRKTGAGYYRYADGGKGRQPDPVVRDLIDRARAETGISPRSMDDDEIRRRALLAITNEAALLLAEGVAVRAADVDLVLVNGYGFPRWEGGPVFLARESGHLALERDLDWLAGLNGPGFTRADPAPLLG
ncbi:3-hydroxyacyl-CoA dehydrogenase NAD-binding domain-containing protein [Azospirillum sp. TSA6c]|uniref:3-hydroxyacyl-CoA dehydrogenase NAD-binding domain-containing protein n=1 Tax=unclassified Azospirillum TaxID=2630922 RepID=UPI000D607601|nr:3-hydroxyacyl-CoA dehydrogenase NAD-binding domain-containing protein [Azospirillum sp. TSA6c]PWC47376.1 3-hydroxyacyl-CoA dehydrogenase [Azospirillum sp. TSA6c]